MANDKTRSTDPHATLGYPVHGVPIDKCLCGSTDFIQQPSMRVVCRVCGRPFTAKRSQDERP